ncbi:type I restriction enzyme, R subunit [Anaerobium acetethylicum]|uniref:Type I restriction enzyme, R subunit n=1 Tax=Anaerobium acetethylicum TaxID=1619234 RepID=A0A1D3TYN6_9FIRM|nr:type I restriction enzyme, R subunit [Anaerobium acetethylicum]
MVFTNTKESDLEVLIVKWMVEQNAYEQNNNVDYNRDHSIDEIRLFHFRYQTKWGVLEKW